MLVQEVTKTSKTFRIGFNLFFISCLAIFALDVSFIYFFRPDNPLLCLALAFILWAITVEDYYHKTIDLRLIGVFFAIGLLCRGFTVFYLFTGVTNFLLFHVIHEICAKRVFKTDKTQSDDEADEICAPPYIPFYVASLLLVFLYYLSGLPISPAAEQVLFLPSVFDLMDSSLLIWSVPFFLFLLSVLLHYRARRLKARGYDLVYRGFGEGDIYFFGAAIGVFGAFLNLFIVIISLVPAYYVTRRIISGKGGKE